MSDTPGCNALKTKNFYFNSLYTGDSRRGWQTRTRTWEITASSVGETCVGNCKCLLPYPLNYPTDPPDPDYLLVYHLLLNVNLSEKPACTDNRALTITLWRHKFFRVAHSLGGKHVVWPESNQCQIGKREKPYKLLCNYSCEINNNYSPKWRWLVLEITELRSSEVNIHD